MNNLVVLSIIVIAIIVLFVVLHYRKYYIKHKSRSEILEECLKDISLKGSSELTNAIDYMLSDKRINNKDLSGTIKKSDDSYEEIMRLYNMFREEE